MSDDVFDTSSKLTSQDEPSSRDSSQRHDQRVTGLIGWFATNHVAANLIWVLVVGVGIYTLFNIKVETMPAFDTERIQVSMSYPGTSPEDIEETITVKIEEAIKDIEGIDRYYSFSNEGNSSVTIVLATGYDLIEVTNEVKAAVDSISSFPPDAYPPRIGEMTMFKPQAIAVQVSGDVDPRTLAEVAEQLRKEIIALEDVSFAELNGVRPYEIRIEISESTLQRYGLTLERVAQIIRQWSVNVSSGAIETESGSIRVRATGQAYTGEDYEQITILTNPDGTSLKLGQIAAIHDGFVDYKNITLFNGKPSIGIQALARGEENDVDIAAAVTAWAEKRSATLPASIDLTAWASSAYYLKGHLTMMLKNLLFGAFLVFLALSVFLHLREALWVVVGLPVAFLGAVIFLPALDVTISMPSLFGFIVVIGIVVDDAIIIAESAHAETMSKGYNVASIVRGAQRVAVPATFGVLTTVAAFMPLMFATGPIKNIIVPITSVVIFCLLFSLVESKLILPSHLALMKKSHSRTDVVADWTQKHLKRFVDNVYVPLLRRCMEFRYATLSFFFMLLIGASMLVASGLVPFGFFPGGSTDFVRGEITLVDGAPDQLMVDTIDHVNGALDELRQEFLEETGDPVIQNVFAYTRNQNTEARFQLELSKLGERPVDTAEVARRWREKVGDLAHAEDLSISASQSMGSGSDLDINLRGDNTETLERAGDELVEYLRDFNGMFNVQSSATAGPREMRLAVKPAGQAAGLTLSDLGRQVRYALYGAEVQRIQRGSTNLRVMVKYPKDERSSVGSLDNMWVRLPDGSSAPFDTVAEYEEDTGYSSVRRENGARTLAVSAEAERGLVNPQQVLATAQREFLPGLVTRYPGVTWKVGGTTRDEMIGVNSLIVAFSFAMVTIYALMAIPLRSYLLPILIMSVIPFGIIGAVFGHWIMRSLFDETIVFNFVSMIGCIALSGVVVNDSLILVHYVKRKLAEGADLVSAITSSGKARFRAILLTSLTTFLGLMPILFEQSSQAKMIANMAISIAFGILFATMITLILIPTWIRALADIGWNRAAVAQTPPSDQAASLPAPAG